jgi:hypothetical protein
LRDAALAPCRRLFPLHLGVPIGVVPILLWSVPPRMPEAAYDRAMASQDFKP